MSQSREKGEELVAAAYYGDLVALRLALDSGTDVNFVVGRFMSVDPVNFGIADRNVQEGTTTLRDGAQVYALGVSAGTVQIAFDNESLVYAFNSYAYAKDNPYRYTDPLGLWQLTITGGAEFGGRLTFGHNYGQWNVGVHFGAAEGFSASLDPRSTERHKPGFEGSVKAEGKAGLGPNVDASAEVGPNGSSADVSVHVRHTPVNVGVSEEKGIYHPEMTYTFGDSGFFGAGGTIFFGH